LNSTSNNFLVFLPTAMEKANVVDLLHVLQEKMWIDRETMTMAISLPIYNMNHAQFVLLRIEFTFDLGGGIQYNINVDSAKPNNFQDDMRIITLAGELVLLVAFGYLAFTAVIFILVHILRLIIIQRWWI
jgi:hypothetical protein